MAQVTITINAREYAIACEDGQELRIMQLARVLDEKAKSLTGAGGQVNENMLLAMVGLLIADELSEVKKGGASSSGNAEAVDKNRLLEIDSITANAIEMMTKEINSIAKKIESL